MENVIERSFGLNLKIMSFLGLYPPKAKTKRCFYKVQACISYFVFVLLVPAVTVIYIMFEEDLDILKLNYTAIYLVETVGFTTKLLPFLGSSKKINSCVNYFGSSFFTEMSYNQEQKKIIEECVNSCQRNTKVFVTIVIASCICFNLRPIFFWSGYKLPIDMWLPFDISAGPTIYYPVYLFVSIAITYNGVAGTIVDPLIAGLACHAAGQLKILENNLEHLSENANQTRFKESENNMIYRKVQRCIQHHNAILTFVKEYEEAFSLVFLSQCAGSVCTTCFCCLSFSLSESFSFTALTSLAYMMIVLGQIYFYCYYGTQLFEQNNNLATAIYMGEWYNCDPKSKYALIILMERAKRPMIVTGGKIIELTLGTFVIMLKRSYSLLAVLQNYQ